MTKRHRVTAGELDALAGEGDDAGAVEALRSGLYSRRVLLLRGLLDEATSRYPKACKEAGLPGALRVLVQVQERSPKVFDEVLLHPQVGGWIASCLRRLGETEHETDRPRPLHVELAHLGAIAASAALRAGEGFTVRVPLDDGKLVLPLRGSTGSTRLRTRPRFTVAKLRTKQDAVVLTCNGSRANLGVGLTADYRGWQRVGLRSLRRSSFTPSALRERVGRAKLWRTIRKRAIEWQRW